MNPTPIFRRGPATRAAQEIHHTLDDIVSTVHELRDGAEASAPEPATAKTTPTADERLPAEMKLARPTRKADHHDLPVETRRPEPLLPPPPSVAPPPMGQSGPQVGEFVEQREAASPRSERFSASPPASTEGSGVRLPAPALPLVGNPPPVVLPAVPDISRQMEVFVATVNRNQQMTVSALERATSMLRAYEFRFAEINRELKRLDAVLIGSFRPS